MFEFIFEMWRDGRFEVLEKTRHEWGQMDKILDTIGEKFQAGDEAFRKLRATILGLDGRFELVIENGPGGGWARLCGKRTGQRG